MFPGSTDYTGVDLEDILADLRDWRDGLAHADVFLGNVRARLAKITGDDAMVKDGLGYLDYFTDLFRRYHSDFLRVLPELPRGVRDRHVTTLRQLYESSRTEETYCVNFKQTHYLDALVSSNEAQMTLAEIYAFTRDEVVNLRDLGNVVHRLAAFVTDESVEGPSNALELKPNFFGLGLNLNYVWQQWGFARWKHWRSRKG
jgi:hypothetical protein